MPDENRTTDDWWPSTREQWLYWQGLVRDEMVRQQTEIERLKAELARMERHVYD